MTEHDAQRLEHTLLGDVERTRVRPRGFAPWAPKGDTLVLLEQVRAVLDEYEAYLPITLRQLFYRLVGAHEFEKTERAYRRLGEHLNRARRAGLIPMSSIRDDGGTTITAWGWDSVEQYFDSLKTAAERFNLDRTIGQKTRLVVFCEAEGMVPQLAKVAEPYGVEVTGNGGFDSVTDKHNFARKIADDDRPCEVLHIGDHDPSGAHMCLAFFEDVAAFTRELGGEFTITRLTPAQIKQYRLPTAFVKEGDRRAFAGLTCQAEALAPDVLSDILLDAIKARIDHKAYAAVLRKERAAKAEISQRLGSVT